MKKLKVLLVTMAILVTAFAGCSTPTDKNVNNADLSLTELQSQVDKLTTELTEEQSKNQKLNNDIELLQKENEQMKSDLEVSGTQENSDIAPIETERKFIVDVAHIPSDMKSKSEIYDIVQTYISYSPEMRVREINGDYHYFTMKLPKDESGLSRQEIEFKISKAEYDELIKKQVGSTINKTRYQFHENDIYIFVDVYSGGLEGLAVAEVEFESVEASEKFTPPDWFGKDVTSEKRYKNANLAKDGMPNTQ